MSGLPIPPATLRALAALALLLAAACAVVNGWFFALGLDRLEPDVTVRAPLLLAGWLMVATEHVAVGLAALLPSAFAGLRRRLLWLGMALLAFECVSMFAAQRALEHGSLMTTSAQTSHAAGMRTAIDSQRATLEHLRSNGARQSESANGWRQHLGAAALRDSLAGQQRLQALESELVTLNSGIRPTLTGVLGESGATELAAARALLIGVMGLVLMSAAGQLWAAGRTSRGHDGGMGFASKPRGLRSDNATDGHGLQDADDGTQARTSQTRQHRNPQIPPRRPSAMQAKARDRPEHATQ